MEGFGTEERFGTAEDFGTEERFGTEESFGVPVTEEDVSAVGRTAEGASRTSRRTLEDVSHSRGGVPRL
ncbi:hypothetical protein Misp01_26040 [Microtetraspora sp. NBRC 13810]|nr:hypothetical protein Misp01_26040 [Microtetraspora sp. NBRC 13810]